MPSENPDSKKSVLCVKIYFILRYQRHPRELWKIREDKPARTVFLQPIISAAKERDSSAPPGISI